MNSHDISLLIGHLRRRRGAVLDDQVHLEAAIAWLQRVHGRTISGGIAGFYSVFRGWYDAYPETTGYIIQTFVDYAAAHKNTEVLARAAALGDWEIAIQLAGGGVRSRCLKRGLSDQPMVFDTGQVLLGWSALYRSTGERRFRDAALRGARWLCDHQESDGRWAQYIYRGHCGTYHARVAWALLRVAHDAGREDFRCAALRAFRWIIASQAPSGFFPDGGFRAHGGYYTHALAYTLEGLFGAAAELEAATLAGWTQSTGTREPSSDEMTASALRTCSRFAAVSLRDGGLYGEYRSDFSPATRSYICVPGTAQMAWCLLRAYASSRDVRYLSAGVQLIDIVKQTHLLGHGHSDLYGGLPGSEPIWGRYQRWRIVTWGAKFLADVLMEKGRLLEADPGIRGAGTGSASPEV